MISSQILQNTIDELHGITRVDFAVMDTEGNEELISMQPILFFRRQSFSSQILRRTVRVILGRIFQDL